MEQQTVHLPGSIIEALQPWMRFVIEMLPLIAAISSIVFVLVTMVMWRAHGRAGARKSKNKSQTSQTLHLAGVMISVLFAIATGFALLGTKWMMKPQEVVWRENVDEILHRCLGKIAGLPDGERKTLSDELAQKYETPRLHCLAYAVQKSADAETKINANSWPARVFRTHMRLADSLLSIPDAGDILGSAFSIDERRFLGFGFSLPTPGQYDDAATHEFLIRNRCATVSTRGNFCNDAAKTANDVIFTWIFDPPNISDRLHDKLSVLLASNEPQPSAFSFKTYLDALGKDRLTLEPPVLVRFARLPKDAYLGTVGRPLATYVFFSNLAELWNKGLLEAQMSSGASTQETPGQSIFVWIYFPSDNARAATWTRVFNLLERGIVVDPKIQKLTQ